MYTLKKLFSILTPQDHAKKALDQAVELLHSSEIEREDAQAKAARLTQDIAMLKKRIKRLRALTEQPDNEVVGIDPNGASGISVFKKRNVA